MRDRSFAGKTARKSADASSRSSFAGGKALALSPPGYGIDFIDRGLQTGPPLEEEEMLQSWIVGGKADEVDGATSDAVDRPLAAWVTGGAATAGTNTIKCDGSGGIVVQAEGTGSATSKACMGDCVIQHEESHKADALAANAKICDGAAAGNIVTVDTAAERKATEVKASNVEIACLRGKPDSDACRDRIATRIAQMITYRDSF